MRATVKLYTTSWCGHCRRLKRALDGADISYEEIDLDEDPAPGDRIIAATGGYRTVPTVEVEGRLLVNPSLSEVEAALV